MKVVIVLDDMEKTLQAYNKHLMQRFTDLYGSDWNNQDHDVPRHDRIIVQNKYLHDPGRKLIEEQIVKVRNLSIPVKILLIEEI